jgi:hypothetical protein
MGLVSGSAHFLTRQQARNTQQHQYQHGQFNPHTHHPESFGSLPFPFGVVSGDHYTTQSLGLAD